MPLSVPEIAGALAEGVGDEWAMANLSAASCSEAEDGSKLVYNVMSTEMAVRLAPTPPYVAPNTEDFLGGHSVDKLTPDVDGIRVAVAQHVPLHMEWGYTVGTKSNEKNGFIIPEVTRRHLQLEAHLYEQVATMVATLRATQEAADAMGAQTTGLQESLQVMEARVREWDTRELQWEQEKGQFEGSVAEAQARLGRLALSKEEVERSLHELQGQHVDLEMTTSKGVKDNEALKVKNRDLVNNNRNMSSFARSADCREGDRGATEGVRAAEECKW